MIDVDRASQILARCGLFCGVRERSLRALAAHARTRSYRRGTFIFSEGDAADSFYVLVEGRVRVFVSSGRGEEMVLAILGPSDPLGEIALFDGLPRSASAEVLDPVTALVMPRSVIDDPIRADPGAVEALLVSAAALLRNLTSRSSDMVFLDVEGRVAKLLVEEGERHGRSIASGTEVDLGISQSDIGRMVGGSRQTVNQIFRSFEARRYIQTSGRTVIITAPGALRRRASLPQAL